MRENTCRLTHDSRGIKSNVTVRNVRTWRFDPGEQVREEMGSWMSVCTLAADCVYGTHCATLSYHVYDFT